MQFTVLIEFLIPGLATTLLALALLPGGAIPQLTIPNGETATALLLLAVSYPIGILINFPIFIILQQRIITPITRRIIIDKYVKIGLPLVQFVSQRLGLQSGNFLTSNKNDIRELFGFMSAE